MIGLKLRFKGERTYLHGPDIFIEIERVLVQNAGPGFIRKLVFKNFAKRQCALITNEFLLSDLKIIGNGLWLLEDNSSIKFWVVEIEDEVAERYPFDEEALLASSNLQHDAISLSKSKDYSCIDHIVTLTKSLNASFSPIEFGKWIFGQIELQSPLPKSFKAIRVKRVSGIRNKFSRNQITIDGEVVGEIRFIVANP